MRRDTILFDFGGVVTTSPFEAFARMEADRGLPVGLVRRINAVNSNSNAWALFERAEIDADRFDELFAQEAAALGEELRGNDVLALLSGDVRPGMVAAIDRLKGLGYRVGCITNNVPRNRGSEMGGTTAKATATAAALARFEMVIESSREGLRKPDPRIYALACDRLGVAPAQCVYLDDLGINCKPAAAMGMAAIKVAGEAPALATLEEVLGLTRGMLSTAA